MGGRHFLQTRFQVLPGRSDDADHWLGGPAPHRGAHCQNCKIPLLLLWDINANDRRFPRGKFGTMQRVPLYFCWGCCADLAYRVTTPESLEVVHSEKREGPSFPYERYPSSFDRKPLALTTAVPKEAQAVLAEWDSVADPFMKKISKKNEAILAGYVGHGIGLGNLTLFHHQFGGAPLNRGWEETFLCPNNDCPKGLLGGLIKTKGRKLSFLAGVLNDPWGGLPMIEAAGAETEKSWNFFVTVQFHICSKCFTIYACNRAD